MAVGIGLIFNGGVLKDGYKDASAWCSQKGIAATHELRPRQWLNLSRIEQRI